MTMRPPAINDGAVPSQRKRVASVVTTSSQTISAAVSPASKRSPSEVLQVMLTTATSGAHNDPHMYPVTAAHNPKVANVCDSPYSQNVDSDNRVRLTGIDALTKSSISTTADHLAKFSLANPSPGSYLSVSSSSNSSSSDSGSSSDCGKDLVKRKRYTPAKTTAKTTATKYEVDGSGGAAGGRRSATQDPPSSLTLVKNSASLIFTKKISGGSSSPPVVHRKRESRGGRRENRCSLQGIGEHGGVETVLRKERTHSWYASLYTTLDEEVELDPNTEPLPQLRNLAFAQPPNHSTHDDTSDSTTLLDHSHQHQAQIHQSRSSFGHHRAAITPPNTLNLHVTYHQLAEGPQVTAVAAPLGGPIFSNQPTLPPQAPPPPKYSRFEQLIKSLVGRKVSRDASSNTTTAVISTNPVPTAPSTITPPPPAQPSPPPPPTTTTTILSSPEILITRSPSERNLIKNDKISSSTASLNAAVQQKLWNVVPLLRREGSCASLQQLRQSSTGAGGSASRDAGYSGLKKCETVLALSRSSSNLEQPIRAQNRLRDSSTSTITCSRCSSLLSLAANGSRYSLNMSSGGGFVAVGSSLAGTPRTPSPGQSSATLLSPQSVVTVLATTFTCKLCLGDVAADHRCVIGQCGCTFCTECMVAYVEFEILEGAYEISCPDALCPVQGALTIDEITSLSSTSLVDKHNRYRLNREVELDKSRTWCPRAGCDTVCLVATGSPERVVTLQPVSAVTTAVQSPCSVHCPTCREEFCSGCKKTWHPAATCEENNRRLAAEGLTENIGIPFDNDLIKCCPTCSVPIEKDEGCAQMMCKRCKHVFCWYCLASLDDDFLLRHYDRGPCKNKLGHSRASVVWHRAQVIGIFAGFGILLLVASPLLLLAAPCIVCCKCRICSSAVKLEENEVDFEEIVALQR